MTVSDPFLRSDAFSCIDGLHHGFTQRTLANDDVLDLGRHAPPARWHQVCRWIGMPGAGVAMLSQVHGRGVVRAESAGLLGEGDALITHQRGLLLAIRTADCVPVLVLGEDDELAAIHAGWRGVAAGVVPATLAKMSAPKFAVVGPCITVDAYQVGEEVIAGIVAAGVPESVVASRAHGIRPHADLKAAVGWQLSQAGVEAEILPHCTFLDPNLHSHRRDGARSGRLAAVIGWSA